MKEYFDSPLQAKISVVESLNVDTDLGLNLLAIFYLWAQNNFLRFP